VEPCIYCGDPADSEEHIWGTWLIDVLRKDPRGFPDYADGTLFKGPTKKVIPNRRDRKGRTKVEFTTDRVCGKCNSEWMNRIDERANRPGYMEKLVLGQPLAIDKPVRKAVAAWTAKTAVTARFAHISPSHVQKTWTDQLLQHHAPSADWRIWIAEYIGAEPIWYEADDIQLTVNMTLPFRLPGTTEPTQVEGPIYEHGVLMTLAIGHLAVQVLGFDGPPIGPIVSDANSTIQIWPDGAPDRAWPPPNYLDDTTLLSFALRFTHPPGSPLPPRPPPPPPGRRPST